MFKRFLEWIGVKEKLHTTKYEPPLFKDGEIWWCHAGENIGIEMNGKGERFTRPFLVFKKYSRYSFLGLPLTTKIKMGTWYVLIHFGGKSQNIILAQGRVFDYRRLKEKMGELEEGEAKKVKNSIFPCIRLIKIDPPPFPTKVVGKPQICYHYTRSTTLCQAPRCSSQKRLPNPPG